MMKISHTRLWRQVWISAIFFAVLVPTFTLSAMAQTRAPLPIPTGAPTAIIKRVMPLDPANAGVKVSRGTSPGAPSATGVSGFLLYAGDVIETHEAKVTVEFLDEPVALRDNEVIIDANSLVGISSTYSWWGTVWAKVKGAFESKTTYAQAGAKGTEYQFSVFNPSHSLTDPVSATLVVLEGSVQVTKRRENFLTRNFPNLIEAGQIVTRYPQFVPARFILPPAQEQFKRGLEVTAGQITPQEVSYNLHNDCHQTHRLEFRVSDTTPWLQLEIRADQAHLINQKTVEVEGKGILVVNTTLQLDARKLLPGSYPAHVYVVCLDCNREARCPEQQLYYPYLVSVQPTTSPSPSPSPSPSVSPTPTNQVFVVDALKQAPVTREFDQPSPASTPQIQAILGWTNQVLTSTQPSYAAQNLVPHFATIPDRSRTFATERERAILANKSGSYASLGDVYSDWGQPGWAFYAYEKEMKLGLTVLPPEVYIDRGDMLRLTGDLDKAAALNLSTADAQSPKAQNLFGNIALDRAHIALDQGNSSEAEARAAEAKTHYSAARSSRGQQTLNLSGPLDDTLRGNLAEGNVLAGESALQRNSAGDANAMFSEAARLLEPSQQAASMYPFPVTDLGVAFRGQGDAAVLAGDLQMATDFYAKAKRQHEQAIATHQDFAEAYFNLGDLYDDLGDRDNAKLNYRRSIQARPEQPAAYLPLAMLLKDEEPALAAALAATYLKLERDILLHGRKGEAARSLAGSNPTIRPPRIGERVGGVPNVIGQNRSDAEKIISSSGYRLGNVEIRATAGAANVVLDQNPRRGANTSRGAAIDIVVSRSEQVIPDVIGKSEADARTLIEQAGYRVGDLKHEGDLTQHKGYVFKQDPKSGERKTPGTRVKLFISRGRLVKVPRFEGETEAAARSLLGRNPDLTLGTVEHRESCDRFGLVIDQKPDRGKEVEPGTSVNLVVSSLGDDPAELPNFVGRDINGVQAEMNQRGLSQGLVINRATNQSLPGTVLSQSREPGRLPRRCRVDFTVAAAPPPETVSVPNLCGKTLDEARKILSSPQFGLINTDQDMIPYNANAQTCPQATGGQVKAQSPLPQSPVLKGSRVKLMIVPVGIIQ